MNATAYLAGLGWKGEGHTLQPSGRGLKKPLLAAHKQNVNGLGLTKDNAITSQWWLDSFDKSLKAFDLQDKTTTTESLAAQVNTKNREDATQRARSKYFNSEGLYARFVIGDGLKGTLGLTSYGSNAPAEVVEKVVILEREAAQSPKSRKRRRGLKSNEKSVDRSTSDFTHRPPKLEATSEPLAKIQRGSEVTAYGGAEALRFKAHSSGGLKDELKGQSSPKARKDGKEEQQDCDISRQKVVAEEGREHKDRTTKAAATNAVYYVDTAPGKDSSYSTKSIRKKKKTRRNMLLSNNRDKASPSSNQTSLRRAP